MKLEFSRMFFEKSSDFKFREIRLVGAKLLHATEGRTDMTKLIVTFCNFAKEPKKNKADGLGSSGFNSQEGGTVVSHTHRPSLSRRKYSSYTFWLEAELTPACGAVPQPTAPPCASPTPPPPPAHILYIYIYKYLPYIIIV